MEISRRKREFILTTGYPHFIPSWLKCLVLGRQLNPKVPNRNRRREKETVVDALFLPSPTLSTPHPSLLPGGGQSKTDLTRKRGIGNQKRRRVRCTFSDDESDQGYYYLVCSCILRLTFDCTFSQPQDDNIKPAEESLTRTFQYAPEETSRKKRKRVKKLRSRMYMDEEGAMGERQQMTLLSCDGHTCASVCWKDFSACIVQFPSDDFPHLPWQTFCSLLP